MRSSFSRNLIALASIAATALLGLASPAAASSGCTSVNAAGFNFTALSATSEQRTITSFVAGDKITFNVTREPPYPGSDGASFNLQNALTDTLYSSPDHHAVAESTSYTVTGTNDLDLTALLDSFGPEISVSATCVPAPTAAPQTITFLKPADQTIGAGPVALIASATSGLTVGFASTTPSVCTISGASAIVSGVGTCSITASQAGNASWLAAPDVVQTFAVGRASQTIDFAQPRDVILQTGLAVALNATASSGLPVTLVSETPAVCTMSDTNAILVAAGLCTIRASQAGNASFNAAPDVTRSFLVLGNPALRLGATATPTAIAGINQTVSYTFLVRNGGNVPIAGLTVTDTRVSGITCLSTTLAAGASTTCTGSTLTTAADITSRGFSSTSTARGTFNGGPVQSDPATVTIGIDAVAIQQATTSAIQSFLAQRANLLAGSGPDTYRMHQRLGGDGGGSGAGSGGTGSTFAGSTLAPRTASRAVPQVLGPGAGPQGLGIGGMGMLGYAGEHGAEAGSARPLASPFRLQAAEDNGIGRMSFATSLSQIRAANEANESAKRAALAASPDTAGPGISSPEGGHALAGVASGARAPARPAAVDVWVEGSSSHFSIDRLGVRRHGQAGVVYAGVDYVAMPGLLIGVLGQWDWMSEQSTTIGHNRDGRGWMTGPYMSARLTRNLYFDARAAWGQSSNHVDPLGAYVDAFSTSRALASAKLTGDWSFGAVRFRPSAEAVTFTETQKAYVNAIGIPIPGQTYTLGRALIGPEIAYRMQLGSQQIIEPFVGIKGIWDFSRTQVSTAAGLPVGADELRARIEAGAAYRASSGFAVRAIGAYDGLGSGSYRAWQGQLWGVLPLQ